MRLKVGESVLELYDKLLLVQTLALLWLSSKSSALEKLERELGSGPDQ